MRHNGTRFNINFCLVYLPTYK